MRIPSPIVLLCLAALFQACGTAGSSISKTFGEGCWPAADSLTVSMDNPDTSRVLRVQMPVTFTDDYPYHNLHLQLVVQPPRGTATRIPLNTELMTPEGVWQGSGPGETIDFTLELKDFIRFNQQGQYRVSLIHYMRDEPLCGVKSAGLRLTDAEK